MPRKKKVAERWEGRIGIWPHTVWYGERPEKNNRCYTRTWSTVKENWEWKSCMLTVRDAEGNLLAEKQAEVFEIAKRCHDRLTGDVGEIAPEAALPPVTIGTAWPLLTGEGGRFPNRTSYRDELEAGIEVTAAVLGAEFAWMHLDENAFNRVVRHKVKTARAKGHTGFRAAIQVGTTILTIMSLLREKKRLPATVIIPGGKRWRDDLKKYVTELSLGVEPEPIRRRHTPEEMRELHQAVKKVDPRFALIFSLGAEIRLGQVRRARRSSVDRERGIFRSPGLGKKKGAIVEMTDGQRRAFDEALAGYLAPLDAACADYPLFPAGQLAREKGPDGKPTGKLVASVERHAEAPPVDKRTLNDWFRAAEIVAGITHVKGRGAYGVKRVAVDAAIDEDISEDALKEHGGWTSSAMPQGIYRDRQREKARHEAALVRAKIRGENVSDSYPGNPKDHTEA